MKNKSTWRIVFVGQTKNSRRLIRVTALGLFALTGAALAQQVIAPPPSTVSVTPPAITALGPSEMQVFPPDSAMASVLDELHPLKWGPVILRPHASYQFTYGTGIRSSTNQPPANTIIQSFAPGILFVVGTHWTLDYTPTFTFYSDKHLKNSVGQSVILTGGTAYGDWILGFSQSFTYSSSPQIQTGTQSAQQIFSTVLTASYQINSKFSTDLAVYQNLSYTSGFQDTRQWSTMDWLNYQVGSRLSFGAGAGFGYVSATPDSLFEQLQGRVNWRATDKISFGINGGAEFTQFTDGGSAPLINPIFSGSIQYLPWDYTQISIGASRAVNTSYYQNQITEITSVNGGINQRLFKRLHLNVNGAYNWTTYVAAASGAAINNPSHYYSVNVQLNTSVFKRGSVGVFYNYSQNVTDQAGLGYSSNQVGFNIGYAF